MGRGKFKGKPTGKRNFSTPEEIRISLLAHSNAWIADSGASNHMLCAGTSSRPRTFKKEEVEDEPEELFEEESEEESEEDTDKRKGVEGIIQIENPNLVKPKTMKAKDIDLEKTTELSRREREELEKQKAHERYMKLQEQGKTEQARKDLDRLTLIRQQRAEAAKKREEEKAAKEQKSKAQK